MSLIQTKSNVAAANILERVKSLYGNYAACVTHLNTMVRELLSLNDDDLASFANERGADGLFQLTTLHGEQGDAVNKLIEQSCALLADSGINYPVLAVDVRPLNEKLADQGRELVYNSGVFSIVRIEVTPVEE